MSGFLLGVRCGLRGIGTCATTPRLWPWAIAPILVGLVAFGVPMVLVWSWATDSTRSWYEKALGEGAASWLGGLTGVVFGALVIIVAYFVFGPLVRIVAAPFLALLSDRWVRELAGGDVPAPPGSRFTRFVVVPVRDALVFLGIRLALTLLLLPLLCVPLVGAFLFAALLTPLEGADRMDVALSSRAVPVGERLRFARTHLGACAGLGAVVTLLLLVPGVNLLLLPGVAVGAVLLDRALSPDFPGKAA